MLKLLNLVLMFLITTPLVMAQHTIADQQQLISEANEVQELAEVIDGKSCKERVVRKATRKIERQKRRALRRGRTIEDIIAKNEKKTRRVLESKNKMLNKILKKERRVKRLYKKTIKNNELSLDQFKEHLKGMITEDVVSQAQLVVRDMMGGATTVEQYFDYLLQKVANCNYAKKKVKSRMIADVDVGGFILATILIGVAVLIAGILLVSTGILGLVIVGSVMSAAGGGWLTLILVKLLGTL